MVYDKQAFLSRLSNSMGNLAQLLLDLETLNTVAITRGYATWTDADLAPFGYTRAEVLEMFALASDLRKFMGNQATTVADRWALIHKYRIDV